jgi:hypothetical protein
MVKIFFHKKDLDGQCSGGIARYYFETLQEKQVELIPFDYGDEIPKDLKEQDLIVFVDVSVQPFDVFKKEILDRYDTIVIDHHISLAKTIKENNIQINGIVETGKAACELAWEYFFDEEAPRFVKLLSKYDTWQNDNKKEWENVILPFQYGMRCKSIDPTKEYSYNYLIVNWQESTSFINEIINIGKGILEYQQLEDKRMMDHYAFEVEFEGLNAICVNSFRKNSQAFESKYDPARHDIMIAFNLTKDKIYTISLYSTKIDCSVIAKKYNGGGHKKAAGFQALDYSIKDNKIEFLRTE